MIFGVPIGDDLHVLGLVSLRSDGQWLWTKSRSELYPDWDGPTWGVTKTQVEALCFASGEIDETTQILVTDID